MTSRRVRRHPYRLTKAKRNVLALLAEYFCLRVTDVAALRRGRAPCESDLRSARRTLSLLYREGHANRLPYFDLHTEGVTHVYGLSDRALKTFDFPPTAKSFDEHSERTLAHELGVTAFHIALRKLADQNGLTLYWQQRDLKRGIHPDALFALTDPSKPDGRNTHYFFLEIERTKLGQYRGGEPSIMRKLERYAQYFDSNECARDWNLRTFRVVVVQQTDERVANLLRALASRLPTRTFWLTSESACTRDLGAPIFFTPKDHAHQAYSFLSL